MYYSDPDLLFSHFYCLLFPPSCFHVLLSFQPLSVFLVFFSHPFIHTSSLYQPPTQFPPSLFCSSLFFAFGILRDALPVIQPLQHLSHPGQEREKEAKRRESRKKKRIGREDERSREENKDSSKRKGKHHTAFWLNEQGQRMITIEYIMLFLVEAIN